jgi:SAM-dependent methyltransferase
MDKAPYPHLERVAAERGRPKETLVKAFEIECELHSRIIEERDPAVRERLYFEAYEKVHQLHKTMDSYDRSPDIARKTKLVKLFRKELEGKSILDVGCGNGAFLQSVDTNLQHERLVGIDISPIILPQQHQNVEFLQGNIINFKMDYKFDVVFSDNVMEHIAAADIPAHLQAIRNLLVQGGTFIVVMPNRLFGPHDITRIIDTTYTNQVQACGGHLNETTYTDIISTLEKQGFSSFKTVIPISPVKYYLPNVRISPRIVQAFENSKDALRVIYRLNTLSVLVSRLEIMIICTSVL